VRLLLRCSTAPASPPARGRRCACLRVIAAASVAAAPSCAHP
jgi:hypothetical protein